MASQLQKLAVIEIDGQTYDLAANGHGALVTYDGPTDAYTGQAQARVIDLAEWIKPGFDKIYHTHENPVKGTPQARVQALLDLLAAAYRQLQSARDSKLGVGRDHGHGKDGGA